MYFMACATGVKDFENQRKAYMLRHIKKQTWETIADQVVNLSKKHPSWGCVRDTVQGLSVTKGWPGLSGKVLVQSCLLLLSCPVVSCLLPPVVCCLVVPCQVLPVLFCRVLLPPILSCPAYFVCSCRVGPVLSDGRYATSLGVASSSIPAAGANPEVDGGCPKVHHSALGVTACMSNCHLCISAGRSGIRKGSRS